GMEPDKPGVFEEMNVTEDSVALSELNETAESAAYRVRGNGLGEAIECGHAGITDLVRSRPARLLHGFTNVLSANRNLYIVQTGTGDGKHHRASIAEVALKLDRSCSLRKVTAQRVELQIDVVEHFFAIGDVLRQLHVDNRQPRQGEGSDSVIRSRARMDRGAFCNFFLHSARDQLLHFRRPH